MLIVNNKVLNENTKDPDLVGYAREYQNALNEIKTRFPSGHIQLRRIGYPKTNKNADGTINLPEIPSPIFIKLTKSFDGVVWGYCKGRPLIHPNGLVDVPPNDNSETLDGEVLALDVNKKPDYAFFILYKSGILGTEYNIYDPEGDRLKDLTAKNNLLKVQYAIREVPEEKLRLMAMAWGIPKAGDANVLILQDELEKKVFAMDEAKKKNPTDLSLRGIDEFLAESKNDDVTRPKAIIQMAIDEKKLTFAVGRSEFNFGGDKVCFVPPNRVKDKEQFLANYLRDENNKEKWLVLLRGTLTKEYIEGMDKYGVRWACEQFGVPVNQKEDKLRAALLEMYA